MEIWDLYTADGQRTGMTMTRGEKIPEGYFHMVCDVLIRHTDGDYLLMLRSKEKRVYPGRWESSCGGSALAGEDAITAARRELREETGIECEALEQIGYTVNEMYHSIHYSFLGVTDCPKDTIKLQPGETEGYRWVSEAEFRAFVNSPEIIPTVKGYLRPWLKQMGYVTQGDQVPLTVEMLVDTGICPTCYDRSHNFVLYGDPAEKTLYENDLFTCVLIGAPRSPGHTCIISKAHYKDMMEIPDDLCTAVYLFAKKAMNALKEVYGSESVYLCTMCDGPMNHFHVQLIPRYACEKRGSKNFVKTRQEYIHDPEKIAKLRELLKTGEAMKEPGTKILETDRLILRPFTLEDAENMYHNWASDPEVTKFLTWPAHNSIDVTRWVLSDWVSHYPEENYYQWAIELKDLGQPIGSISVVNASETAQWVEIGYCIGQNWWRKGLVPEALKAVMAFFFDQVGVGRICARHDPRNPGSGAVMRKCGMTCEGTMRRSDVNNQGICDAVYYSILREEYDRKHHMLCELNDEKVLGTDAVSTNWPRLAARAVVRNRAGLIGLVYVKQFDLYALPGGGVENGESPEDTVRREVREEAGCTCGRITPLGIVFENRGSQNFVQQSWYYAVEAEEEGLELKLTEKERSNGSEIQWHTLEETVRLIDTQDVSLDSRKFVRLRDLAALEAYKKVMA